MVAKAAESGLRVIPQVIDDNEGKRPPFKWAPYQERPATEDELRCWARDFPNCLWGFLTGQPSGYIVLDFDGDEGKATLDRLGLEPMIRSHSGGFHVYVKAPKFRIQGGPRLDPKRFPGMDLQADGQLATFYGTHPVSDHRYRKVRSKVYTLRQLPDVLQDFVRDRRFKQRNSVELPEGFNDSVPADRLLQEALAKVQSGEARNGTGFWLACQLRDERYPHEAAEKLMGRYAEAVRNAGRHSYTRQEAYDSLRSAYSQPAREPRALRVDPLADEVAAMFAKSEVDEDYVAAALDDAALRRLPPPDELIPGWVPLVGVSGLWAPPGFMKTFVIVSMAKAVRRGKRWQHHSRPVKRRGAVLFFEGEVVQQLPDRQDAFDKTYPLNGPESPQWTIPKTPDLTTVAGVAAVIRTAEAFRARLRAESDDLALIVFDPLPEFMTGEEVGDGLVRAVRALCWIAERLQVAVVVGHQSNAAGERARGHDVFRQKVFVLSHVERPEPDLIALVQDKNKFRPELALTLFVREVDLPPAKGEARSSVVLEYERGAGFELLAHQYLKEKEDRIARAKRRTRAAGSKEAKGAATVAARTAFVKKSSYESGRRLVDAMRVIDDTLSDRACHDAINVLVDDEHIEIGEKGPNRMQLHTWNGGVSGES